MAYTKDGIMAQIWVVFGQGAGAIRVSHDAAMELHRWYYNAITQEVIDTRWEGSAVQALERIRAIGGLAALTARTEGAIEITPKHVYAAAAHVQTNLTTDLCPPIPAAP